MSQPPAIAPDPNFDLQMKSLADEAQQFLDDRSGRRSQPSLLEFLRPLVQHMELLGRTMTENTMAINRLEETTGAQAARLQETVGAQAGLLADFRGLPFF